MSMRTTRTPPADWDTRVSLPALSRGFADASATLGHRPLYVEDGDAMALVLERRLAVPGLASWTARASVYIGAGDAAFVTRLLARLARRGVAHVRLGDAIAPLPVAAARCPLITPRIQHLLRHPSAESDAEAFARLGPRRRWAVRRAERAGVLVSEVRTEGELAEYAALAAETGRRMRERDVGALYPAAFFSSVFRTMVPRGQAQFLLARAQGRALAGALLFTSPTRMTYVHGVSTRDSAATGWQGPTAVVWHALRLARKRGVPRFDLGAVTPTDDPCHPNYPVYVFMREFGGEIEVVANGDVVISPTRYAFQQRIMMPLWKRWHARYMAWAGARAPEGGGETASPDRLGDVGASDVVRANARAVIDALHAEFGPHIPSPTVSDRGDDGLVLTWMAGGRRVEIVCVRTEVGYAVRDAHGETEDARFVDRDGALDRDFVLQQIVKRYVLA
jgi:hypothetical protein